MNFTRKELYVKYITSHPDSVVSWGTFLALRPFYVRTATTKDVEVCCCKLHLHARWSVNALIKSGKKQNIDIGLLNDYSSFFNFITSECPTEDQAYISWDCTPDKKHCVLLSSISGKISEKEFCHDLMIKFSSLSHILEKESI